ncbi:retention module-containing protein [uncultured Shewanella sp.]|uniref:retention module-containing protein n=1 Tax=uncultured Shewanella sp. TaxID=173975 RepID=UPI00262ED8FF|nr:retention module-containing protein [uncultured Shewanella sp.]
MGVSIAKQDAVVTNLVGQLKAKDEQGNIRDVSIGDLIKNGEQLIFSPSAQFILEMADGTVIDEKSIISEEPPLSPTPEEGIATAPVSTDAEIAALQAQILAGEDPTAGLPETAAGTAAGAGGNEGTDFVTLDRTADETIAGSGYDTSGFDPTADTISEEPIIAEENILPTLTSGSITVSEVNLPQGSAPSDDALSQIGAITLAAPNGISQVLINGVAVFSGGVFAGPTTITSASGTLNITGFDAATGILSYSYTLNSAVDHSAAEPILDTFAVSLTDILGNNTTSTITANLLDDAPSGLDDSGNIGEDDVSVSGSVIDNDTQGADSSTVSQITNADGTSLAVAQATIIDGSFGALQISADGSYSYLLSTQLDAVQSLAQGEQVTDSFTYQLTDSDGDSVPVTLTVTITGTNDAPVITTEIGDGADQGTVIESGNEDDGTLVPGIPQTTGTLTATDIDNGAVLSWSGSATGTFGNFVIDAVTGQWSYTLDNQLADSFAENSVTQEEFLVTVTDEFGASATQLVTITINGTNDSPIITSTAADATGSVNEQPAEGVVLEPDTQVATGTLTASDVDTGAVLSWSGDADSTYGSFSIDPVTGEWTYTLDNQAAESLAEGEVVQESFLVTVTDEFGAIDTQTVTINITGSDEATIIANDSNTIDEDSVAIGNVLDNDSDEDDLLTVSSFSVEGNSYSAGTSVDLENGTLLLNGDGSYVFTPDANWNGNVPVITYTTNTGATATLTIVVEPVNDAPNAFNNSYNLNEGGSTSGNIITDNTGSGIDNDIDGGALSITHINGVAVTFIGGTAIIPIGDGTLTINQNGSFTYNHNGEEPEPTSFTYTINDGLGGTDTATVSLNISNVNDAPETDNLNASGNEDTAIDIPALSGSDIDGTVVSFIIDTLPSNGTLMLNGVPVLIGATILVANAGDLTFEPNDNWNGETSFTYHAVDDDGLPDPSPATVNITVTPVNDGPEIISIDLAAVSEEGLLYGLKDTDGEPDDTTNEVSFVGTLSFTDVDSSNFAISIDDTNIGQYYSGDTLINWNWSGNTLTGSAGSMTVMTVVFDAVNGTAPDFTANYTVTLFAPVNHDPDSNIEDVLPLAFAVTVDDLNGGSADTTLTVNIEDDSPVDKLDPQAEPSIVNSIGQYITGDLFAPGADDFGNVIFDVTSEVKDNLLYNGSHLSYDMDGNTLVASSPLDGTTIFTLTAVPDGNGQYDYKLVLLEEIQLKTDVTFEVNDAPAGFNETYYVDSDGKIYSHDGQVVNEIATITSSDSLNSNEHGIGVGSTPSIDTGEKIVFHYGDFGTLGAQIVLGTGVNATRDGNSTFNYTVTYMNGETKEFTDVVLDGTYEIEAKFTDDNFYSNIASIEIEYVSGDDFQITLSTSTVASVTENPLDLDFTYTATDADGDSIGEPAGFTVVVEPDTGNDDINVLAGTDADDDLLGGIESDYIIGGTGDDTISGGAGADILIGSEGSDTIDAGIDTDRDAIIWEVGSADESVDTIYNFNPVYDVLNLSDVLVNEAPGALEDFLSFNFVGGSTEIVLDTNGTSSAGGDTLTILLDGVDLSAIYGPSPTDIINGLLDDDALIIDVP